MADADHGIVSDVAKQLASIVTEQIKSKIMLVIGVDRELLLLSDELNTIGNVLHDAEIRQFKEKAVEGWLRRLEQTSYKMEDVLEEWNYALLQLKMESESEPEFADFKQKVCSFISSVCLCFKKTVVRHDIAMKIQDLKSRLDEIVKEKDRYNFGVSYKNDIPSSSWRVQSDPFIILEEIQGRNDDKEFLVSKLTANGGSQEGLGYQILSIVGAGGLGKTTLAQLLYNDSRVIDSFDLRVWLCVSDPFDVVAIAKRIIECVTKNGSPITNELSVLLEDIKENIFGKKILLVLDDVWNEEESKWKPLAKALKYCGAGSKILVTSRKENVAKTMSTNNEDIHYPELLSEEDCWWLLKHSALTGRSEKEFGYLHKIGKRIAAKCNGLPLAAKTLGSLLYFKYTTEDWLNVLMTEMWQLEKMEEELFPHLFLSYQDLSPRLRRCFSYCAFFPKDEKLNVEQLIRYWMALGYIDSNIWSSGDNMELRGRAYFQDIAMRSLFQEFEIDHSTGQIVSCKMHDIVHDFAQFLHKRNILEASRMTKVACQVCDPDLVSRAKEFRSLFWDKEDILKLCDCLTCLRVLRLSHTSHGIPEGMEKLIHLRWLNISGHKLSKEDLKTICELYFLQTLFLGGCSLIEIPTEIKNLVQLRYLDLSFNQELEGLPESMYSLFELQTLDIKYNTKLCRLPEGIHRLKNLKHLMMGDVNHHPHGHFYPDGLGQLIGLRTLGVLRGGSDCNKLGLLKSLNLLTGQLDLIIEIKSTSDQKLIKDAQDAELKKKIHIQVLRIYFNMGGEGEGEGEGESESEIETLSSLEMGMLEALEPSHILENLIIFNYNGLKLPLWISSPLNQLRSIQLHSCRLLSSLPAMGQLPHLEVLEMWELSELKVVGRDWLGIREGTRGDIGSSSATETRVAFPTLKKLLFTQCCKWDLWEDITPEEEESTTLDFMPSLTHLTVTCCEHLKMLPHRLMRRAESLKWLNIRLSSELENYYGDEDGVWRSIS